MSDLTHPWPYWLLRCVATDDPAALLEVTMSVASSPPAGGVSPEEALAVMQLLLAYGGSGMAPAEAYDAVSEHLGGRPEAMLALEVFRLHDRIASDPESFGADDAEAGLALAGDLGHDGVRVYFTLLLAQLAHRNGDLAEAARLALSTLPVLDDLAAADPAYLKRARGAAQNAAAFAAMSGDVEGARRAAAMLDRLGGGDRLGGLLADAPAEGSFDALSEAGSAALEAGDPVGALERFAAAEQLAAHEDREAELCGMLGDMAVAYNRVGNTAAAVETYFRAIELCRRHDDVLNLSRWTTNLVGLLVHADRPDEAEPLVGEMLDAAARTGRADQLAVAAAHLANFLVSQERYAEATERLREVESRVADDALLAHIVRENLAAIELQWGTALLHEGRLEESAERLEASLEAVDLEDEEQRGWAARAHSLLAVVYERLGDEPRARQELAAAGELSGEDLTPSGDDPEADLTAAVNAAGALLATDPDAAVAAFDELLPRLRARGDRRRELILSLNFIDPLRERGETARAVQLAERCLEISAAARPDHRAVALLQHGRIAAEVLHDGDRALQAYRDAVTVLRELDDPEFLTSIDALLARGALNALDAGDSALAKEIAALAGHDLGPEPPQAATAAPSLDELRAAQRPDLDAAIATWRAGVHVPDADAPTPFLRWFGGAAARLDGPAPADVPAASAGGPAGLLALAEAVDAGTIGFDEAEATAAALAVDPDDAAVVALFAMRAIGGRIAGLTIRLVAGSTPDGALAARLLRALLAFTARDGDHRRCLELADTALAHLEEGAEEDLRAELLNERAFSLLELRRYDEALEAAEASAALADARGLPRSACMARGNVATILMRTRRLEEARDLLEALAEEQRRIGDADGLATTEFNLRAVRNELGDTTVEFDPDSEDPDENFAHAIIALQSGDHFAAVKQFEAGFAKVEAGAWAMMLRQAKRGYPEALAGVGRVEEAVEHLGAAARELERDDMAAASDAYVRLSQLSRDVPRRRAGYAEAAVRTAQASGDAAQLAEALRAVGAAQAARAATGDQVQALTDAWVQDRDVDGGLELARSLVRAHRAAEALPILEELEARAGEDPAKRIVFQTVLGLAREATGDREGGRGLLAQAHEAGLAGDHLAEGVDASHEYAQALMRAGLGADAVTILQGSLERVAAVGNPAVEAALGLQLGTALGQIGEVLSAERVLARVCEYNRAGGNDVELGRSLAMRGDVALTRGDLDAALEHLSLAAELGAETNDRELRAAALDSLGRTHTRRGVPGRAVEYHRESAAIYAELGAGRDELIAHMNLAETLVELRDGAAAEETLHDALALSHEADPVDGWRMHLLAALVTALQGDWDSARPVLRTCLEALHRSLSAAETPAALWNRVRLEDRAYGLGASAAVRAGDAHLAVELLEARRARFLHAVVERRARRPEGLAESDWLRYERAADDLSDLRAALPLARLERDPATDARLAEAEREHADAFAAVFGVAEAPDAPSELPHFDRLVEPLPPGLAVAYLDVGESLEIACAGRDADGRVWARAAADPRLRATDLPAPSGVDALDRTCELLGDRLWPALLELLPDGVERLVLLPSSRLAAQPLAAATLADGGTAADHLRLAIAPSLTLLTRPVAETGADAPLRLGQAVDPTGDLPFSRLEADTVAARHDGPVETLPGGQATAEAVLDLLRTCDVVHFAGHARFDADDPLRSHLACAPTDADDGRLTIARILDEVSTIRPRLVVLSACESGAMAAHERGDELVGLPGTLLVSGADAVLASDREIGDLEAALLVGEFFGCWRGGAVPAAAALAEAQRRMRADLTVSDVAATLRAWAEAAPEDPGVQRAAADWDASGNGMPAFPAAEHWAPFQLVGMP